MKRLSSIVAGSGAPILGAVLILAVGAVGAVAAPDAGPPVAPALGNAIVSTHPDGRKAVLWLKADGGYEARGRAGNRSGGVWRLKGARLCLTQKKPVPIPIAYCQKVTLHSVGQPLRDRAVNGDAVVNEIVRGG